MKINTDYKLKNICDENVVIYVGSNIADFRKTIKLNDTAAFMWKCFAEGCTTDECAEKVAGEYKIDIAKAKADVEKFADQLIANNMAE